MKEDEFDLKDYLVATAIAAAVMVVGALVGYGVHVLGSD